MINLNKVTDIYGTGMPFKSRGLFGCFCSNNGHYIIPQKKYENYIKISDTYELNNIIINGYVDVNGYLIVDGTVIVDKYIRVHDYLQFNNILKCVNLTVKRLISSSEEINVNINNAVIGDFTNAIVDETGSDIGSDIGSDSGVETGIDIEITGSGHIYMNNLTTACGLNMSNCNLTVSNDANIGEIIISNGTVNIGDLYLNNKSNYNSNVIKKLICENLYLTSNYLSFFDTDIECNNISIDNINNSNYSLVLTDSNISCNNIELLSDSIFVDEIHYPNIILNNTVLNLSNGSVESNITCENIYVEQSSTIYLYNNASSIMNVNYIRTTNTGSIQLNVTMENSNCFPITAEYIQDGITLLKKYYNSQVVDTIYGTM